MAGAVTSVPHAGLQHKRSQAATQIEAGAHAVGIALVLTEIHVHAAHELAAENHVQQDQRVVVGRVAGGADVTDAQLGLRRAGSRHDRETLLRGRVAAAPARHHD